jgi:hypothetical protein
VGSLDEELGGVTGGRRGFQGEPRFGRPRRRFIAQRECRRIQKSKDRCRRRTGEAACLCRDQMSCSDTRQGEMANGDGKSIV